MKIHAEIENFTRDMESIEKNNGNSETEKNVVTKIKNPVHRFNCRLDTVERN